jgi:dTDP-4-dehydrorhamnose 3,5-epimerase
VELRPYVRGDERGSFTKVFQESVLADLGLPTVIREQYHSSSIHGVVRGLHFQVPPHDHAKYVFCLAGQVIDVAVDLRPESPTYGRHVTFELDAARGNGVFLPRGFAHGFAVVSEEAILLYMQTSEYAPDHDAGIRWDSAGIDWPIADPILSARDAGLPPLSDFVSPFTDPGAVL